MVKIPPANAGDVRDSDSIPGSRRPPGGGNGNPLQYSCLENSMDKGAWWATVHGLSDQHFHFIYFSESVSCAQFFVAPWTVAHQAPLSMEFSRQKYWRGLSFPSPGNLPNPRIELQSPALQADSLLSGPPGKPSCILRQN